MDELGRPVRFLKGVGPKRGRLLEELGVKTLADLLHYYPRAWEDRRETPPGPAPADGPVVMRGRVLRAMLIRAGRRLALYKASVAVPAWSSRVDAVWFKRQAFGYDVFHRLKQEVRAGADLWIVGRAKPDLAGVREVSVEEHYRLDDPAAGLNTCRPVPVYPLTEGLTQAFMRRLAHQACAYAGQAGDVLPEELRARRRLLAAGQALAGIHFPRSFAELEEARRRLAYEELLLLELAWSIKQRQVRSVRKGFEYELKRTLLTPFRGQLGFELTNAQKRVINEIFADMQAPHPMTRLLQGDVGSGKTVVALAALLLAVESGGQGAFMAPTELLAEQHFWTFSRFLRGLPVRCRLLTSRVTARERAAALEALRRRECDIVIGTHALLEEDVSFADLRLAVIDEQHRFGVRQRATVRTKGPPMDLLVMTATPIPRTLALALYGDLSVSTLDELPPGRRAVATRHGAEDEALARVRERAAEGRQAYVVYPIISESSRVELKAAKAECERLKAGPLAGLRVALIHGRLTAAHKTRVMEGFLRREHDVLVSTPVIEVGMDVANAAVMVVQNADRFGLASLHQLRGRVGRGAHPAECWLVAAPRTPEAERRIGIMCETSDGFKIGEEDLKLRGPGEFLGTSQHGAVSLRVADIFKDADLQAEARPDAEDILAADPDLAAAGHAALRRRLKELYADRCEAIDLA